MLHRLTAFWLPFWAAVFSAAFAIAVFWAIPMSEWRVLSLDYLWLSLRLIPFIGLFVAAFSLIPCTMAVALSERHNRAPNPLTYVIWGFWTGLVSISLERIATSGGDFSDYKEYMYWLPVFAFSGAIGGGVFGLLRRRLL